MARIIITIEDGPNNKVKCEAKPNFAQLMTKEGWAEGLTPAEVYAIAALMAIRKKSKESSKLLTVGVPRIYRA